MGNSGEPNLAKETELPLVDPSPLVRGAAVWALAQLAVGTSSMPLDIAAWPLKPIPW